MTAAGEKKAVDALLVDELLGFRAAFSDRECDGSPLRIRAEGGESEQTEANMRAVLWDAAQRIKAQAAELAAARADAAKARDAGLEEAARIADRHQRQMSVLDELTCQGAEAQARIIARDIRAARTAGDTHDR